MTHKQEADRICSELEQRYGRDIQIHAYSEDSLDIHISFPNTWKQFDLAVFTYHNNIADRVNQFFIDTVLPELDQIGYEIKAKENT